MQEKQEESKEIVTVCPTDYAKIFVGRGVNGKPYGVYSVAQGTKVIQQYVDEVGLCIEVKDVDFIYSNGREKGLEVSLRNYPRFYDENDRFRIRRCAIHLANVLKKIYNQDRVMIEFPDRTVMIGDPDVQS